MGHMRGDLDRQDFTLADGVELSLIPNDSGGTQNAYLGLYIGGRHVGSLCGETLAAFAKALRAYENARLEPGLREDA